jgi:V/A-type H+/Na+-transporting ATPase subunit K
MIEIGLIAIGAGLAIGLSALASAYAMAKIGSAGMALLAEKEEQRAIVIILVAIPETLVILGFVIAILIMLQLG